MYNAIVPIALSGLALASAQVVPGVTGQLGNAQITQNNPAGTSYRATLPNTNTFTNTTIRGYVQATSNTNGTGVLFNVNLSGFPAVGGPYIYHIHAMPVPANGNCTAAAAHLDPYVRGEAPPCDSTHPETCQVGDLSGKHGNITTSNVNINYLDLYVSTKSGSNASLGGLALVVHNTFTQRLTCANFLPVSSSTSNSTSTGTGSGTGSTSTSTVKPFVGAGVVNAASLGAVAAGALGVAAFFM